MYNDCILTSKQAELSIRRIAYQIYEDNTKEDKVIIAGVITNGNQLAKSIAKILRSISDLEVIDCQIQVAVLINRNHKKFPIKADYKGISLSTSLHEHVEIVCKKNTFEGYLS